jgi:phosphatidylinositol alpha-1,6-mannosyltransferase
MRLLLVSPCIEEEFFGGVQLTARLAWEGFAQKCGSNRIRMLCYGPRCGLSSKKLANRSCSRSKTGTAFDALQARNWAQELIFWHVDLIKLLPFLGSSARRKYLFLHGIECWRPFDNFTIRLLDRIDMFLTNSEFTWNRFIAIHPRWKNAAHRTVRLGVGVPEPSGAPPGQIPAAVIIGRMNASEGYKGHRELIEAWPLVLARVPSAELWIVGGGDGSGALRNLASEGTASRQIKFCGVVSDEEKQSLLRQARCMVLPSRGEGFGLVYLEAMRLGRPCLSSIHDAGQEVIGPGNSGIAVEPGDRCALAEAVAKLVSADCTWEQWSANARRSYESQFTAAHFQQRLVDAVLEGQVQ